MRLGAGRAWLWGGLALVAAVVAYTVAQSTTPRVAYDLADSRTARLWLGAGDIPGVHPTPEGLEVIGSEGGVVVSPEPGAPGNLAALHWRDARFLVIDVRRAPYERNVALVWFAERGIVTEPRMLATLPAGATRLVIDTQRRRPWLGGAGWVDRFPADGLVRRVGLAFRGEVALHRITVQALLPPRDLAALIVHDLAAPEPVLASSINFHYGPSVLGVPLSIVLGLLVAGLGMLALVRRRPATLRLFAVSGLLLVVLFDATVFMGLGRQVLASRGISAWHAARADEVRSRFGDEAARLDALVREHVPRGTPIAVPDPPSAATARMTNWLWFLYQGEYPNVTDRARDNLTIAPEAQYVVFDQPRLWSLDPALGVIRNRVTGATVAVAPVASVTDSVLLLKVMR